MKIKIVIKNKMNLKKLILNCIKIKGKKNLRYHKKINRSLQNLKTYSK